MMDMKSSTARRAGSCCHRRLIPAAQDEKENKNKIKLKTNVGEQHFNKKTFNFSADRLDDDVTPPITEINRVSFSFHTREFHARSS